MDDLEGRQPRNSNFERRFVAMESNMARIMDMLQGSLKRII